MPQWISDIISVAPWLGAILISSWLLWTVCSWLLRKALPFLRKANHLVDDLLGEAARPGVPARPGIVEDMALLRQAMAVQTQAMAVQTADMAALRADVDKVKQQVKNSHSTNLRDDVDKVISNVSGLHEKLDGMQTPPIQTTITVNPGGTP